MAALFNQGGEVSRLEGLGGTEMIRIQPFQLTD